MTIRTITPNNYIPPTRGEMREMANRANLQNFSPDLVEDLCYIAAGGKFVPPSQMVDKITVNTSELVKASDGDYKYKDEWIRNDGGYVSDLSEAKKIVASEKSKYHHKVQDFVRTLDLAKIPGSSPLEKAMNTLSLLAQKSDGEPTDEEGDDLPIFSNQSGQSVAKKLKEVVDSAEKMTEPEKELLDKEGKSTLEIAKDLCGGEDVMLRISRQLDKLTNFKTSKSSKVVADSNGDEIRYRAMRELSEMGTMHPGEWVYPKNYRNYRMVTGQSPVRERCSRQDKKQLLYILVDASGSMESDNRFQKAGGVLMNRLKAVLAGDAEVTFAFFTDEVYGEMSVTNVKEAKAAMSKIVKNNFDGSSTEIADCVKSTVKRIKERLADDSSLTKPELLVVTDGCDDTTDLKLEDLGGIKLHSFLVGGDNDHLVKTSRRNGGVGIANL